MENYIVEDVAASSDLDEVESSEAATTDSYENETEESTEVSTEVGNLEDMTEEQLMEYLKQYYGDDFDVANLVALQENQKDIEEDTIDFDTSNLSAKLDIIILLVFLAFAFTWLRSIIK